MQKIEKERMLASISRYLSNFGPVDEKILDAIMKVDRRFFVPRDKAALAYIDEALEIEKSQTISQPSTVARMLSLLDLKKNDSVLEIGTGSGWNASLIAYIAKPGKVLSLDIHPELTKKAKERNSHFKLSNLKIKLGDFRKLKEKFGKIIFTAGIFGIRDEAIISNFAERHLKNNGILVCPHQAGPLIIIKKDKSGKITKTETREEYVFVPLILD